MINILEIIDTIGEQDPEIYGKLDSRRSALRSFKDIGKKLTLTTLPLALGSMFQKAYGQSNSTASNAVAIDVFNFALVLEYMESKFYRIAVSTPGLIPSDDYAGIALIAANETAHVNFLKATIIALGGTPIPEPNFDYTGGKGSGNGPFKAVFSDYNVFTGVAQTFENTGVRAYKGQAGKLLGMGDILEAALRIHSVEGRHAAHLRLVRELRGFSTAKPWITGNDPGFGPYNPYVQLSFNGEENTVQAGINIVNINGKNISVAAATESFDEPLTREQVMAAAAPFMAP